MSSPLRWTVIDCQSPYECDVQFVADINLDPFAIRTARVPLVDRALAAKGWVTVGNQPTCPDCFVKLEEAARKSRDFAKSMGAEILRASTARSIHGTIEVG